MSYNFIETKDGKGNSGITIFIGISYYHDQTSLFFIIFILIFVIIIVLIFILIFVIIIVLVFVIFFGHEFSPLFQLRFYIIFNNRGTCLGKRRCWNYLVKSSGKLHQKPRKGLGNVIFLRP